MRNIFIWLVKKSALFRISLLSVFVALFLYIINRIIFKKVVDWLFIHHYFNDILAGILIVAFVNGLALLTNQPRLLLTKWVRILIFTFFCGVFWEYVTPLYVPYSVSDPFDVYAYMFGGFIFWLILRFVMQRLKK